jgi:hypothetical protein
VLRRVILVLCALAASLATPLPAMAANKDIERLQIQISSLQGQLADLQRVSEDTLKEIKRLNESMPSRTRRCGAWSRTGAFRRRRSPPPSRTSATVSRT